MSHLKRQKVPKNWPIRRKGTTYVVRPNFSIKKGIPVLIILRDILKVAQNRKDIKRIIHAKQILLNNKLVKDEKNNVLLFDTLSIVPTNKFYRMDLSNKGKFKVKEIEINDAGKKIAKIINKKVIKGKKVQLNLSDGRNFLSDLKCNVKDSVLINLLENKIETVIPLKEKVKTVVLEGKHTGERGVIKKMKNKTAEVKIGNKNVEILIKQLMAVK
ncbi:30S ribosomal protein S4e [Candidatus Pacearchaeota archaeon]|nr:30S ribosomal protein S4e [Candidatus Pacearchaeota archaeon]